MRKLKKIRWNSGNELLGFAIALPMILVVFCAIIMAAQLGLARQTTEYALYSAARAAVVQENLNDARNAAQTMAGATLDTGTIGVSGYNIELETVAGSFDVASGLVRWEKGALVKVVLTVEVNTIAPFQSSVLSSELIMMIERPATP